MPLFLLIAFFAGQGLKPNENEHSVDFQEIAASGRALLVESPDARVTSPLPLSPGPPPLLSFRFYEGKQRHRFGDVDIMLDDAGH